MKSGLGRATAIAVVSALAALVLAACSGGGGVGPSVKRAAFTSKEFGVASSPRVTRDPYPPRGGGRYVTGKPYTVAGRTYVPEADPQSYAAEGKASWYGADFHGRRTANGEIFSANAISGAHPTLPLPSYVRVTNLKNGRSLLVRINDRGPYLAGRVIDLSYTAANMLGYVNAGSTEVAVHYVGPAPLNGDDTRMLVASLNKPTRLEQSASGNTRFAFAAPQTVEVAPQVATRGSYQMADASSQGRTAAGDIAADFLDLFSYADAGQGAAASAAARLAARQPATATDVAIALELGDFRDHGHAIRVAEAFAALAAVDETMVDEAGGLATRLTLTRLKPGVTHADVLALAGELGLTGLVLY